MKRSSLFGHVIELHDIIRAGKRPADVVVSEFFRSRHYLGSKDRRFISDIVYGLVRNFKLTQVYAEEVLHLLNGPVFPKGIPSVVSIAVYCVRILDEKPADLLPDISGLWRVYIPDIDCQTFLDAVVIASLPVLIEQDDAKRIATHFSFPESIVREWVEQSGTKEAELLCASLNSPAPISIRVNLLASSVVDCIAALSAEGIEVQRAALSPVGLKLSKRINAQASPSYKRGLFEMQDEGSQLLSMLAEPTSGMTVVDACAGGGGKTLHLAALMNNGGSLIAIDVEEQRLRNIHERLRRAGVSNAKTWLASRDQQILKGLHGKADVVLIDAPCTGVGTFRRNPGAKLTFTETFLETVARTQREVLEEYSAMVRPGGRLVYSTCTLLRKENEDQVSSFLTRHPDFELLSAPSILRQQGVHVASETPFLKLLPHKTTTDGFFAAVMVRK